MNLKPAAGQPIDCHSRQNSQIRRSFGDQVTRSDGESSCLAFASGENSSATETGAVWFFFSPAGCVAAAAGTSGARAARPRPAGIERDVGSERHRPTLRPHLRESLRPHRLRRRRRVPPRAPTPRRAPGGEEEGGGGGQGRGRGRSRRRVGGPDAGAHRRRGDALGEGELRAGPRALFAADLDARTRRAARGAPRVARARARARRGATKRFIRVRAVVGACRRGRAPTTPASPPEPSPVASGFAWADDDGDDDDDDSPPLPPLAPAAAPAPAANPADTTTTTPTPPSASPRTLAPHRSRTPSPPPAAEARASFSSVVEGPGRVPTPNDDDDDDDDDDAGFYDEHVRGYEPARPVPEPARDDGSDSVDPRNPS